MAETKTTGRGRPKKVVETIEEPKIEQAQSEQMKNENEELKRELEVLKAQMASLISSMNIVPTVQPKKSNRLIRFVNLCTGMAVLRGSTIWKIDGQFNYQDFMETEASIIVANMADMIRSGSIYIADEEFRKEHNLEDVYRYLLSDEQLKTLLNQDSKYAIDMYKNANDNQKQIILDMICNKLDAGEEVDGNILITLSKLSGKDLLEIQNESEQEE